LKKLGENGSATQLFYSKNPPSAAAAAYIADGHRTGVDTGYKCRVRKTWYRVPLIPPADRITVWSMLAATSGLAATRSEVERIMLILSR
jgi:hypothetical protein